MTTNTREGAPLPAFFTRRRLLTGGAAGLAVLVGSALAWRLRGGSVVGGGGLKHLSPREAAALEAVALVMFPPGNSFGVDGRTAGIVAYVDRYLDLLGAAEARLIHGMIFALDQATFFAGHWRPLRKLDAAAATAYLRGLQDAGGLKAQLVRGAQALLGSIYFEHPEVKRVLAITEMCRSPGPTLIDGGSA